MKGQSGEQGLMELVMYRILQATVATPKCINGSVISLAK